MIASSANLRPGRYRCRAPATGLLGVLVATGLFISPAVSADAPQTDWDADPVLERINTGWQFEIDPIYGWITGMNGTMAIGTGSAGIDVKPIDILTDLSGFLDVLQGLYMGAGEARYDRFGIQYDIVYMDVGNLAQFESDAVSGALAVGFGLTMGTLAANYRIHRSQNAYVDVFAGARATQINLAIGLAVFPIFSSSSSGDETWVDPIIGIKGRRDLNDHWYFKGSAMVGGLGVSSDYLYDLAGYIGYEWDNGVAAYGGIRAAKTSYKTDDFVWDVLMYGPVMGLTLHF